MEALRATFKPEFLNRVDDIIVFHKLGAAELRLIVDMQLGALAQAAGRARPDARADARGVAPSWASAATTRPTARGRSSGRSSATCRIRWPSASSPATSQPGDTIRGDRDGRRDRRSAS